MSEKSITLISKDYAESIFVTGPKFDSLSAFVSGPDAQVQGKLTASTGINLNDNTISVDTATAVGTSNLPVTASAVNTKLGDYATTTDLNNKQDKLSWYSESGGSMDPYKVDIASNIVTLRSGDDTVGMISEDTKLELNSGIHISTTVGGPWRNILSSDIEDNVILGDPDNYIYCQCELYDKDGKEIKGGSSAGGSKWVTDDISGAGITYLFLGKDENDNTVNSIFVCGPLYGDDTNSIFVAGPIAFHGPMILQDHYDSNSRLLLNASNIDYNGPRIGSFDTAMEPSTLFLSGGKGGNVIIEARDSYGNSKTAFINYNNIDKLINLLNS